MQEVKLAQKELETKRRTCKINDLRSGKSLISYTAICTKDYGVTVNSRITFKGNFVREFTRAEIVNVDISIPLNEMANTRRFKYRGPCPKEMAPGETVLQIRDGPTMPKWNRYHPPQPTKNPPDRQK